MGIMPVILLILFFILWCFSYCAIKEDNYKYTIIISLIYPCIIIFLIGFFTYPFWGYNETISEEYFVEAEEVYSLNVINQTSGSFILGCGSVDGEVKYSFYTKKDDLYKLKNISTNYVSIKMDSSQPPKILEGLKDRKIVPCTIFGGKEKIERIKTWNKILIVPENTIKQEFKVN